MSTDTLDAPQIAAPRKGYAFYEHHNSNTSRRRGLCGPRINWKTGKVEFKNHVTTRTVRFPDGGPLPHLPTSTGRSKYDPHVGTKQRRKAGIRLSRALLLGPPY